MFFFSFFDCFIKKIAYICAENIESNLPEYVKIYKIFNRQF